MADDTHEYEYHLTEKKKSNKTK